MVYQEFKNQVQDRPLINSRDILWQNEEKQATLNQLNRWQKRKLLVPLKRGVYLLNPTDRKIQPSHEFLANQLYGPSYVSLEYALNYYDLIPEAVYTMTSVTTKKTARFQNGEGLFIYRHIRPQAFRGFRAVKDMAGLNFFIAEPEKAIVDFLYLNLEKFAPHDKEIFDLSYRFQNLEELSEKRMLELAKLFSVSKLVRITHLFCEFKKESEKLYKTL